MDFQIGTHKGYMAMGLVAFLLGRWAWSMWKWRK